MIENLITKLLDDDHGINEDAFLELVKYLEHIGAANMIDKLNKKVEASDGRFYYPLPNFFGDE